MPDAYQSIHFELPEADSERLQALLHEAGALGLEVRDAEAPPMPGVTAPRPGMAIVVAYFEDAAQASQAQGEARAQFPHAAATLASVPTQDWSTSWRSLIKSTRVGRLWVGPPWLEDEPSAAAAAVKVVIEPKMAFGTGDHPTTALCLEAVDRFLQEHPKATVLDVGTGTGVLAIAALKLGARRAVGTDNDPHSVELARENAERNGTTAAELSERSLDQVTGTFDLVLANILANTLVELAPLLAPKVGKRLVLAGVLAPQRAEVERAFTAQGLISRGGPAQGEWVRLDFDRREEGA
jgi:ribosomal protein L11 methyltransferase